MSITPVQRTLTPFAPLTGWALALNRGIPKWLTHMKVGVFVERFGIEL